MEETVLLPERLYGGIGVRLFGLVLHVGIGDLGDGREVEDGGEQEAETGDGEVDPLYVAERLFVVAGLEEDYVGA